MLCSAPPAADSTGTAGQERATAELLVARDTATLAALSILTTAHGFKISSTASLIWRLES
jgi:hypothetical protein